MRFSVVVPTYRRPVALSECLAALRALRPPDGGYEIVVVNDGGPPLPAALMRDRGHAVALTVIEQANAGPGAARNRGAASARGDVLAFTDDDCQPERDWLVELNATLAAAPEALVGGRTRNALPDDVYAVTSQLLIDFVSRWFCGGPAGCFLATSNLAVARRAFEDSGGFDPRFTACGGEDREFADRWAAAGRPTLLASGAVVQHRHRLTFRTMLRQHHTYGRGARLYRSIRAAEGRPVAIRPSFYLQSLLHPLRYAERRAPLVVVLTAFCHLSYAAGLLAAGAALHRPRPATRAASTLERP